MQGKQSNAGIANPKKEQKDLEDESTDAISKSRRRLRRLVPVGLALILALSYLVVQTGASPTAQAATNQFRGVDRPTRTTTSSPATWSRSAYPQRIVTRPHLRRRPQS
ncbi:MAG TPA: hypothetical protein VGD98_00430 [Ktedonobacteraceae bacterium]